MSASDDSIQKTNEFIEDAQEIIARSKDLMAALAKLTGKQALNSGADPKQLARRSQLEEEMNGLIQRYFSSSGNLPDAPVDGASVSLPQSTGAVRPGRFRQRI